MLSDFVHAIPGSGTTALYLYATNFELLLKSSNPMQGK